MTHGRIGRRENIALFTAALLAAIGGLIYELILGTAASYLLGDSVLSFSLATGITLFGMGIGSLLVNRFRAAPAVVFGVMVLIEWIDDDGLIPSEGGSFFRNRSVYGGGGGGVGK